MHRLFYFLAVMAFAALGAEESKENPIHSCRWTGFTETRVQRQKLRRQVVGGRAGICAAGEIQGDKGGAGYCAGGSGDGKREILVAAKALIPEGKKKPLAVSGYTFTKDLAKVLIYTNTRRVWRVHSRGDYWVLDRASGKLHQLGGKEAPEATLMFASSRRRTAIAWRMCETRMCMWRIWRPAGLRC